MRPNILLILVDDMGYGDFSRFNPDQTTCPATPRLDGLMDEGLTLTQHYTASPVCNPSRAALMTGRYPHRTGSVDTLEWHGLDRLHLRETTLADIFARNGYATGLVGKWHLGAFDSRYLPQNRGFDEAVFFQGGMHDYYRWCVRFGEKGPRRSDGKTYLTDLWTDQAVDFLNRHARREKPWLLTVTYNAPHTPLQCPAEEVDPFRRSGKFNEAVSTLYGMIRRMDRGVERLLETLDQLGQAENTIVLFSSDNGPHFGQVGFPVGAQGSLTRFNCNFNGCKSNVYEGGIRVPGILRWPGGGVPAGARSDEMVHFTDWYPTLLAAAGIEDRPDLPLDGCDQSAVLQGGQAQQAMRCWQWNRYLPLPQCNAAIRQNEWKLIQPGIDEGLVAHVGPWLGVSMYGPEHFEHFGLDEMPPRSIPTERPPAELYHLPSDPGEQNNLAACEPERARQLAGQLDTWFEEVQSDNPLSQYLAEE